MFDGHDVGLIMSTDVDPDGHVGAQVDVPGGRKASVASGEVCFPAGLYGRPHDPELDDTGEPDASRSAGANHSYYGDQLFVWPETDPRTLAGLPVQKPKGSFFFFGGAVRAPAWLEARVAGAGSEMHGVADKWTLRGQVVLGADDATAAVALAPFVTDYFAVLEKAVAAGLTAIGAGPTAAGAAGAAAFTQAMEAAAVIKQRIAATLAKAK